jgi:hypothetical protein
MSMILDGLFLGDQDAARYAWHKFADLRIGSRHIEEI